MRSPHTLCGGAILNEDSGVVNSGGGGSFTTFGPSSFSANEGVSARMKEFRPIIAKRVVTAEIRRRSWRVQVLHERVDGMLALSKARATMHAADMDEGHTIQIRGKDEELSAIEDGCTVIETSDLLPPPGADWKDPPPPPEYPEAIRHAVFPNGGCRSLPVKDYRGEDANQVAWKFDEFARPSGVVRPSRLRVLGVK